MAKLVFNTNPEPTVGIELELLLVDGQTMALSSSIEHVLTAFPGEPRISFKHELRPCFLDINT